jgi:hypothetical protein
MPIIFSERDYFKTQIFNRISREYLDTIFKSLVNKYSLVSAKGSTGKWSTSTNITKTVIAMMDMPYHMHILNGIFPAMKLLEEILIKENKIDKKGLDSFIKTLLVGFTLHDINKLTGKELQDHDYSDYENICQELEVSKFFYDWKNWLNEIIFLSLRTENRSLAHSYQVIIKEFQFFNDVLGEVCHLADSIASQSNFSDIEEFYKSICNARFSLKTLSKIWNISYIAINDNIFTLLSQKLINVAKDYILKERKADILFHLRNGFVYLGGPLSEEDRKSVVERFSQLDIDPVALTIINSQRGCQFGFLESRKLTVAILRQIIESGFRGNSKIKFFEILLDANTPDKDAFKILNEILLETDFPIKSVLSKKLRNLSLHEQKYSFVLKNNWDDLSSEEKKLLQIFAMQKIKFMNKDKNLKWKEEYNELNTKDKKLKHFTNPNTKSTVYAMLSALGKLETENVTDIDKEINKIEDDICATLSKNTIENDKKDLFKFANLYLDGNFQKDIEYLFGINTEIPEKNNMCIFTGGKADEYYGTEKSHGIKALGFNNRTVNTLKSTKQRVSSLFNKEIGLRKGLIDDKQGQFNSCIYYDFGEYLINIDTRILFDSLSQAKEFIHDSQNFQVILDKNKFNYNLYGINFEKISDNVEGNFYFIQRNLKLIKSTGFRIYATNIISSYHYHNEMFIFENSMPFVKTLGWDKIRIDEIEERLSELNLFLTLGSKKLTSNVLNYAEDKKSIFSAYQGLNDDDKRKAIGSFTKFINKNKEFNMSIMKSLAELAIQMARPQSSAYSQETKLIRDSLDILKLCTKENLDRETTIGHIVGQLRQLAKIYEYFNETIALPFAEKLYDDLYKYEWKNKFPQPGRLRHWINEFAFWYSAINYELIKKNTIQKAIDALVSEKQDITENSVIEKLKSSDANKNKAITKYEDDFKKVYQKYFTNKKEN